MKPAAFATIALCLLMAGCSKPAAPRVDAFAKLPDWRGIWIFEDGFDTGISGFPDDLGKPGAKPRLLVDPSGPWTDEGRKRVAAMFASTAGWRYTMPVTSTPPRRRWG